MSRLAFVGRILLACCALGCGKASELPATQIVVAIRSDLLVGTELRRVVVTVSHPAVADGGVSDTREAALAPEGSARPGQQALPLTFSITPGSAPQLLLHVVGWGVVGTDPSERRVVEQRNIVSFQRGKTVLVQMFLGEICIDEFCHGDATRVCFPTALRGTARGECGLVKILSKAQTSVVDPAELPELSNDAGMAVRADAGSDSGTPLGKDAGVDAGEDAGVDAGEDAAVVAPLDSCAQDNGGCGPVKYATCKERAGGAATCVAVDVCSNANGGCGAVQYARCKNKLGAPPACTAVDVCAIDNGGCGSAAFYACTNQLGAPPSCEETGACAGSNVCSAAHPCEYLGPSYTCRGQFADWPPAYSSSTFTVNADETVTDSRSGLRWQRNIPTIYPDCTGTINDTRDACNLAEAAAYCAGLPLAGGGWRLPSRVELMTLVDRSAVHPAMDAAIFPGVLGDRFWSSSPFAGPAGGVWTIDFNSGAGFYSSVDSACRVRCVR